MAGPWEDFQDTAVADPYETSLPPDQEQQFQEWKAKFAPKDSGQDYDLRGAFQAGLSPDPKTGHWPDTFKKPNHPTFSDQSIYAQAEPEKAGHWDGDKYIPPSAGPWQDFQTNEPAPWEDFKAPPTTEAPSWLQRFDQLAQRGVRRALNLPVSRPPTVEEVKDQALQDVQELTTAPPQAVNVPRPETVTWGNLPQTALHDIVGFLESPAGAASPALGFLSPTGQSLVSAGFGSQMITDAIQKVREGKYPEAAESAIFGALGAHGAKEAITPEKVTTAPPEGFEVDKTGVTEPPPVPKEFLPEKTSVTADLTRTLIDARKNLLSKAQDLQRQAEISKAATGQVHPAVELEINAINEELNHPTVGVPVDSDAPASILQPSEAAQRVAESPESTTSGDVQAGQQPVEPTGEVSVGVGPESSVSSEGRGVPVTAGLARSTIEDQINRGVLPEDALVIGEGWNAQEAGARGDSLVNNGINPDTVLDAIKSKRSLPADPATGKPIAPYDAISVLQSETRRLAAERATAQDKFGIGSPQATAAQLKENHWLQTARPQAGGFAQKVLKAFEDTTPVDLGNYNDLYTKAAQIQEGKPISVGQQIDMVRRAKKVQVARAAETAEYAKRDQVHDRLLPKVKTPSSAEMKSMVDDLVKQLTPCK